MSGRMYPKYNPRFMYFGTGIANNDLSGDVLAVPFPSSGSFLDETPVRSGRNITGELVGQKISRSMDKQEMTWSVLDREIWWKINRWRTEKDFVVWCKYFAHTVGEWRIRKFYFGNPSCTPFMVDANTGVPACYLDCKLNVIDAGSPTTIVVSRENID